MNNRLFRSCSVPICISAPQLHVKDSYLLRGMNVLEQNATTTYRLHELHTYACG